MFAAGNAANFLAALARGGLSFLLIIWLQGIWLPLRGYSFEDTPLWAGIYMLPLTGGFLLMGPLSGYLSDRFGARADVSAPAVFANDPRHSPFLTSLCAQRPPVAPRR